jgi:hypothetical protein
MSAPSTTASARQRSKRVVAGDPGLAFHAVDDQQVHAVARALAQLDRGGETGAAEADDARRGDALLQLDRFAVPPLERLETA